MATIKEIKEKARRYDEAIEKFDVILNLNTVKESGTIFADDVRKIFPELSESEDEIVIAALISGINGLLKKEYHLKGIGGISFDRIIAWLEKQGEQKPVEVRTTGYWNVQDIEQTSDWSEEDLPEFESYLCLMFQKFRTKGVCTNGEIVDFVKEHSQKLKDTLCHVWSKEDNKHLERILKELKNQWQRPSNRPYLEEIVSDYYWLNSLKDRIQPKLEWSKEDEIARNALINLVEMYYGGCIDKSEKNRLLDFLKSLRPQNTWKPSDEQIKGIECAIKTLRHQLNVGDKRLNSLYDDLKKLREE